MRESILPDYVVLETVACPVCDGGSFHSVRRLNGQPLVRCNSCRFVLCNPRPEEKGLVKAYSELHGEAYDHFFGTEEVNLPVWLSEQTPRQSKNYRRIVDLLVLKGIRGHLLDVGCSNGAFMKIAASSGFAVTGVEVVPQIKLVAEGWDIRKGTLADASFPNYSFDIVFSEATLEHLANPKEWLEEVVRVLKPNGWLVLAGIPNYNSLLIKLGVDRFIGNRPFNHLNYFTPKTLATFVKKGGFKIDSMRSWGVSETLLNSIGWDPGHVKKINKQGRFKTGLRSFGRLAYNPVNVLVGALGSGSVLECFCQKGSS